MKNQYSFRLTTTLKPTDDTAKTTDVINKVDANGDKFKPNFTEETVVITNDDRTIVETTRATCNNGVLTFTKRGLPDDGSLTPVANRALTWNPGSLCFVTAGASDWVDTDDDLVWSGDQTYTGDMESRGKATYKGRLITEKGVEYPHFDSLEDLQDYASPFGGMFAVVDSDGELYRYNAVTEEWSVVTTSTPAQPAKASTSTIGTVRVATDTEFNNGTATGSSGEYLLPTVTQVKSSGGLSTMTVTNIEQYSETVTPGNPKSLSYNVTKPGFIVIYYSVLWSSSLNGNANIITPSGTANPTDLVGIRPNGQDITISRVYAVKPGTATFTGSFRNGVSTGSFSFELEKYVYFS